MRKLLLLLVCVPAWASNPWAQQTYPVPEGTTVTIPLSTTSAVGLAGQGTIACTPNCSAATSVTYTAPAHVPVSFSLKGCPASPNDDVYTSRIDNLPEYPNSAAWIANTLGLFGAKSASSPYTGLNTGVNFYFIPELHVGVVRNTTPAVPIYFAYGTNGRGYGVADKNPPQQMYYQQIKTTSPYGFSSIPEGGAYSPLNGDAPDGGNDDQHITDVNVDQCVLQELYNYGLDNVYGYCNTYATYGCNASSGLEYNWWDYNMHDSGIPAPGYGAFTTKGNLKFFPIELHLQELLENNIHHAMRVVFCNGCETGGNIWPAYGGTGYWTGNTCTPGSANCTSSGYSTSGCYLSTPNTYSCMPNWGARARLMKQTIAAGSHQIPPASSTSGLVYMVSDGVTNTDCTTGGGTNWVACKSNGTSYAAANTGFNAMTQSILTALANYGAFWSDYGSEYQMGYDSEIAQNPTALAAVTAVGNIAPYNFDFVDESSLMTTSSWVGGGQYSEEVNPSNEYETPPSYAVLTATNGGSSYSIPMALQGVTVGVGPNEETNIQAGVTYQFTAWVNGSTNTAVTWSCISGYCSTANGGGSITSAGVYTAPSTVAAGTIQEAVIQATSVADTTAYNQIHLIIYPAGTIWIDSAIASLLPYNGSSTDGNGNHWNSSTNPWAASYTGYTTDSNWGWVQQHDPAEQTQYTSGIASYNEDIIYQFIVPNGLYNVRYMFGQNSEGSNSQAAYRDPEVIESQGQIVLHNYGAQANTNFARRQPANPDVYFPALVTNNILYVLIGTHTYGNDRSGNDSHHPGINGLIITPVSNTNPHWVVDTELHAQQCYYLSSVNSTYCGVTNTSGAPGSIATVAPGQALDLFIVDYGTGDPEPYQQNQIPGATTNSTGITWTVQGPGSIGIENGLPNYRAPNIFTSQAAIVTGCGAHHCASLTINISNPGLQTGRALDFLCPSVNCPSNAWGIARSLLSSYNGNLINIERASDNTTTDIGVNTVTGNLNQAAVNSFCTGTTCRLMKIYDEIGTGTVSAISFAGAPVIYQNGAIVTNGPAGEPSAYFDGSVVEGLAGPISVTGLSAEAIGVGAIAGTTQPYACLFGISDGGDDTNTSTASVGLMERTNNSPPIMIQMFHDNTGTVVKAPFDISGVLYWVDAQYNNTGNANYSTLKSGNWSWSAIISSGDTTNLNSTYAMMGLYTPTGANTTILKGYLSEMYLWPGIVTAAQQQSLHVSAQTFYGVY